MNINNDFLSSFLNNTTDLKKLNSTFNEGNPFKFLVIDNFLPPKLAKTIYSNFPSLDSMKIKYKGLNEYKAEDSSFEKFPPEFQQLKIFFQSEEFNEWICKVTGINNLYSIDDRLGTGLHQGGNKSFLDIHVDYNIHPIKKMHRKLNMIIFFNYEWQQNWGGQLELWDKDKMECFVKVEPIFNRMALFECNDISYHGYSQINCPESVTRKSYYHYFFLPVPDGIKYHDTIFLPRPSDSLSKKTVTRVKEYCKNKAKLILYKMGYTKFLE